MLLDSSDYWTIFASENVEGTEKSPLFITSAMAEIEAVIGKLEELLDKWLEDKPDHFLVEIKILPGNKVQVFMDADDGIKIDTCAVVSRYLEQYLDEAQPLGEKYILEVSSPGMGRALKVLRQYHRRIGREVTVVRNDGERVEGILKSADDKGLVLEEQIKQKKKIVETHTWEIPFTEIKSTKLNLNF